jgi:putative glutamine amidotransferase
MPKRPLIGIPMRIEVSTDRFYLSRYYSEAIAAAGGTPVHISLIPDADYIESVVEKLDGVLLPGSDSDVDPLRFGQEPHPKLGAVHSIKDETDLLLIEAAERRNLPILAICFGMQVLNVFRGGTLLQDIGALVPNSIKHEQGVPRDRPSHKVAISAESQVGRLALTDVVMVNSHHHQAIDEIGKDLIAVSWASDGVIESLEDPRADRFVVAVQWHPELGWEKDSFSQRLFQRFIAATKGDDIDTSQPETTVAAQQYS